MDILKTQKFYWKQSDKGNSKVFIEFLYQLRQSFPNKMIILILDYSSIHKSKKGREFLKNNPWVKLKLFAPYSPEYNPIERFWLWLEVKVYGTKSFRTIKEVIGKARKFIWHYHENRLVFAIKFNIKPYEEIL